VYTQFDSVVRGVRRFLPFIRKSNSLIMKRKSNSQSAFSYLAASIGLVLLLAGLGAAQGQSPGSPTVQGIYRGLAPVVKFDVSPPLRDMQVIAPSGGQLRENEDRDLLPYKVRFAPEWDPVVQSTVGGRGNGNETEIPGPIVSFNGQTNTSGVAPPDPNGAVGPNHIVTMCNLSFEIFDKQGTVLFGPAANNTLWAGFGGACQTENAGDPVVLYDQLADRWFLMQFTSAGPTFFNCVAVSQTNDPTGAYFRYAISTGINFPDYPKAAVWPDAFYISTREFAGGSTFVGAGAYALNRAQAEAGNPSAQVISFLAPPNPLYVVGDGLLPSNLDGFTLPPAGAPNYFLGSQDNNGPYGAPSDALNLYKFHADFAIPANSTFTLTNTIPVAPFNSILGLCGGATGRACIPQPNTTVKIDHLGYRQRPLFRLAYRNFGDHEALVTNQSVSAGNGPNGEVSGIRWWEIRNPSGPPVIFQEGTYAPGLTDGIHRWMGSIAMDGQGNFALGYSASNGSNPAVFPSVFYTGRLAGDPPGVMTLGEGSIVNGTGSQTTSLNRWGDYTSLWVDPTDDQTFWHVNEWVPTTGPVGWVLRVGSFKLATVADTVTITKAQYSISGSKLTVAATDSNPAAVLTAKVTSTGEVLGTMQTRGDGNYQLKKSGIANPVNITVTSNLGGSASKDVRAR